MIEGLILGQLQGNYELFIYPQLLRQATRERMAYGIFSYFTILTWQIKENLLASSPSCLLPWEIFLLTYLLTLGQEMHIT